MTPEYPEAFERFCREQLAEFTDALREWYEARGGNPDSMSYFRNHWPRFQAMIEMCVAAGITPDEACTICEVGSFYPYTSYFWKHWDVGVKIDLFDIIPREVPGAESYDVDGVRLYDFNLCTEELPGKQYDLVILSEVLEHLPINLFLLCERITKMVRLGGYLLVTYPLGGRNAKDYHLDLPGYDLKRLQEPHLREFTRETTKLFFADLKLVGDKFIDYPAYGRMRVCLYRV